MIYIGETVDNLCGWEYLQLLLQIPHQNSHLSAGLQELSTTPSLFLDIALSDTHINPLKIKHAVAKDSTCTHKGINGICTH